MEIMSKFAENLSALMEERNLNSPALAKILKTDRSNITRYLRGERLPRYQGFLSLLEFFNCSADVLLGLKDYAPSCEFSAPTSSFGERFRILLKETNTSQYSLVEQANISGECIFKWLNDISFPSVPNLATLATFMDISVDYLLGRIR